MRYIDGANNVIDAFGPGKHGFTDGDPAQGTPATVVTDTFLNDLMREIAAPIEQRIGALDPNDTSQLLKAIGSMPIKYVGANYTVTAADRGHLLAATGTPVVFPAASTLGANFFCTIKNAIGTGDLVVNLGSNLDGAASATLKIRDAFFIHGDGTIYRSVGRTFSVPGDSIIDDGGKLAVAMPTRLVTADYTVLAADRGFLLNGSGTGNRIVTLPTGASVGSNWVAAIRNSLSSGGTVTLQAQAGETIDGIASLTLNPNAGFLIQSSGGTSWRSIGRSPDLSLPTVFTSVNYAITSTDRAKVVSCTAGGITITLPTGSGAGNGFFFAVRNNGGSAATLAAAAGDAIDGAASITLQYGEAFFVMCNGTTNWRSVGRVASLAASETAAGVVELATTAETQAGTDPTHAVTPTGLKGALGFSKIFQSAPQQMVDGSLYTLAHGLSRTPVNIYVTFECITADSIWVPGQEIALDNTYASSALRGGSWWADATNVYVQLGYAMIAWSSGTVGNYLTPAKWQVRVRAW